MKFPQRYFCGFCFSAKQTELSRPIWDTGKEVSISCDGLSIEQTIAPWFRQILHSCKFRHGFACSRLCCLIHDSHIILRNLCCLSQNCFHQCSMWLFSVQFEALHLTLLSFVLVALTLDFWRTKDYRKALLFCLNKYRSFLSSAML